MLYLHPSHSIRSISGLGRGLAYKCLKVLHRNKLVFHEAKRCACPLPAQPRCDCALLFVVCTLFYSPRCGTVKHTGRTYTWKMYTCSSGWIDDGYRLTYQGYDYLALNTLRARGAITGIGKRIGVGKEAGAECSVCCFCFALNHFFLYPQYASSGVLTHFRHFHCAGPRRHRAVLEASPTRTNIVPTDQEETRLPQAPLESFVVLHVATCECEGIRLYEGSA